MLSFFSFILMFFGTVNWFFISAFQYDIIAGFFGTQSSLFSRLVYFIIGLAGFIMAFQIIKNKGTLTLVEKRKKQDKIKAVEPVKIVEPQEDEDFDSPLTSQPQNFAFSSSQKPQTKGQYKDFDASKYDN